MKYKIEQIGEKPILDKSTGKVRQGKYGDDMVILTVLTDSGAKLKAWKNKWTDENLKVGAEIDIETTVTKDREGFDETWIKTPSGGRSGNRNFGPRNFWPDAYRLAMDFVPEGSELDEVDKYAALFHKRISAGQVVPAAEAPSGEKPINPDDIPF